MLKLFRHVIRSTTHWLRVPLTKYFLVILNSLGLKADLGSNFIYFCFGLRVSPFSEEPLFFLCRELYTVWFMFEIWPKPCFVLFFNFMQESPILLLLSLLGEFIKNHTPLGR